VLKSVAEVAASRELLVNLTAREVKGKYKRTALGQVWSLVNPLAQMLIYSLVFGVLLPSQLPTARPSGLDVFALWLTSALLPWLLFANVLVSGMSSLIANENLVKKVYFPRSSLVISTALAGLFTSAFEMSVLVVVIYLFGGNPTIFLPAVVVFMVLVAALALGLGFMLAVANVYFRDTQHFVAIVMQMLFYLTPIVYTIDRVKSVSNHPGRHWIVDVYQLNPLERFSEVFRDLLYNNRWPALGATLYCVVVPLVVLVLGFALFNRFEGRLAEEL
jgi:ABC-type polysaccharide/polyol phosphate export permease